MLLDDICIILSSRGLINRQDSFDITNYEIIVEKFEYVRKSVLRNLYSTFLRRT